MAESPLNSKLPPTGLGNKLRAARRIAGLSTWRVAEILSARGWPISHATVANYERERTRPPLTMLTALADAYGVSVNSLLRLGPTLEGVRYRCLKAVTSTQKHRFEALAQCWLEAYRRIENRLGCPLGNSMGGFSVDAGESAAGVAARLRQHLALGDGPVPSVIAVLEAFGVRVLEIRTDDRIDGAAARLGRERVVLLNSALSPDRARLNAAHELGHHLFGDVCQAGSLPEPEVERRAFEFSSHFLLPDSQLREALRGLSALRLVEFKQRFGISMAAMIYRAREARLIAEGVYRKFWMEVSKRGWRTREPGIVLPDRAIRFERMLEIATGTGVLSWQQASAVTGVSEGELRQRVAGAVGTQEGRT